MALITLSINMQEVMHADELPSQYHKMLNLHSQEKKYDDHVKSYCSLINGSSISKMLLLHLH